MNRLDGLEYTSRRISQNNIAPIRRPQFRFALFIKRAGLPPMRESGSPYPDEPSSKVLILFLEPPNFFLDVVTFKKLNQSIQHLNTLFPACRRHTHHGLPMVQDRAADR